LLLAATVLAGGPVTAGARGPGDPWPPNTAGILRLDLAAGPAAGQRAIAQQAPQPGVAIDIDRTPYASTEVTIATKAAAAAQREPAAGQPAPAAGQPAPAVGQQAPAIGQRAPAAGQQAPAGTAGVPSDQSPSRPATSRSATSQGADERAALAVAPIALSTGVAVLLALALLVTREIRVRRARRRQRDGDPVAADGLPAIRVVPHPDPGQVNVTQSTNARSHSVHVRACRAPATAVLNEALNEAGGQP
jgi:hypothetical protein